MWQESTPAIEIMITSARPTHPFSAIQVYVGKDAIMATPAMSVLIRGRKLYGNVQLPFPSSLLCQGCHIPAQPSIGLRHVAGSYLQETWESLSAGGLIMSASHNPGGPKEDWGIKFNYTSGEPAPERITDAIFGYTTKIFELKMADIPKTDLSKIGTHFYGEFEVR